MERAGLKTLNAVASPLHFRAKSSLFRPLFSPKVVHNLHFPLLSSSSRLSPPRSLCIRSDANALPNGAGGATVQKKLLQVVLVSPQVRLFGVDHEAKYRIINMLSFKWHDFILTCHQQDVHMVLLHGTVVVHLIPGNTGSIARTCAASAVGLHLVEPLGFPIDNTKLKRAGLDYWPYVVVKVHQSWDEFREYFRGQAGENRLLAFTKRGTTTHSDFSYKKGDWLVFGSETKGLPPEALLDCKSESLGGGTLRIPMVETYVRCLNLSVSVGIAVYEASRQINYEQLQCPPDTCMNTESSFVTEDIFA